MSRTPTGRFSSLAPAFQDPRHKEPTAEIPPMDFAELERRTLALLSKGLLTPEERRTLYIAWAPGRSGDGRALALRCARHDSGRWRGVSSLISNMELKADDLLYKDVESAKAAARLLYPCAPERDV